MEWLYRYHLRVKSLEVTLNVFLLAKVLRKASSGVYCTESQCVDCKEIEAYPVPKTCLGGHTPARCRSFVLDGDSERGVSANRTEPCLGGLELAGAARRGSWLTSPAWPWPCCGCLARERTVQQLCLRNVHYLLLD